MSRAIGPESTGVRQGVRVSAIGFDAPTPMRVHRGKIGIGDNHFVPQLFEAARNPFAFRRGLHQNANLRPTSEDLL